MFGFKKKVKEVFEQPHVIISKIIIYFKTVDDEVHTMSNTNYMNEDIIRCSMLEYRLIGEKILTADDGIMYPMANLL